MPIANFEEFCKAWCEMAGFEAPRIATLPGGRAFSARLGGVVVTAIEIRQERCVLLAELGSFSERDDPAGWAALLDANLLLLEEDAPRFSRNPETGAVELQWPCSLARMTAVDVFERVSRIASFARAWRDDHLTGVDAIALQPLLQARARASFDAEAMLPASRRFGEFCRTVSSAFGLDETAEAETGDATDAQLTIRFAALDIDALVVHSPSACPGIAVVIVPFGATHSEAAVQSFTSLMDANFAMASQDDGATFCRDKESGDLLLACTCDIASTDARQFAARLAHLASLASVWQRTAGPRAGSLSADEVHELLAEPH